MDINVSKDWMEFVTFLYTTKRRNVHFDNAAQRQDEKDTDIFL